MDDNNPFSLRFRVDIVHVDDIDLVGAPFGPYESRRADMPPIEWVWNGDHLSASCAWGSRTTVSSSRAFVFEVDAQAAHLFKHLHLGLHDVYDVWTNDPLFYPAKPPAHWLMCTEIAGRVLVDPLAPARDGDSHRCRPIGCYEAAPGLVDQDRRDR